MSENTEKNRAKTFIFPVRVYWEDTDGGGIVYYANYLRFLERARTEWLRSFDFIQSQLARDPGIVFAVRSVQVDYHRPARLDDELLITCALEDRGAASLSFAQRVLRGEELLVSARVRIACLDAATLRPAPLPEVLLNVLPQLNATPKES